ncbi:nuclear transport factor 2 family protein [Desulfosarcina sp.]|nr:nuclear transport factor 2 family protein [Desulfosarcina sp.]
MKMVRVALALVLAVCWGSFTFAAEKDAAFEKEITEFVQKHRQAFKEKDIDGVIALYAEDAVLMGTGPGERFVGQEEIRNAHMEYFKAFDKEESTLTWHKTGKNGDVVWVSGMTHIRSFFKNNKRDFAINWTSVLSKQDGTWKFVQRHISNISCE